MKKLFKKVGAVVIGVLSLVGISANSSSTAIASVSQSSDFSSINNVVESTPLYLFHGSEIQNTDKTIVSWHYSHQSHQSHMSHYSHRSHYSSRY